MGPISAFLSAIALSCCTAAPLPAGGPAASGGALQPYSVKRVIRSGVPVLLIVQGEAPTDLASPAPQTIALARHEASEPSTSRGQRP